MMNARKRMIHAGIARKTRKAVLTKGRYFAHEKKGVYTMKKLFALLVAMMMVFSCVPALAETTEEQTASSFAFELPSFTLTTNLELDEEQAAALLTAAGMPEETVGLVNMLLPLLNGMGEKVIIADNGLQYDLSLKGQDVLSLVAEVTESGFALATDLLPSYKLTIQQATIQKFMEQAMQQMQESAGQLDMEQLQKAAEKLTGYAMEMVGVYQSLVSFGEPVKGEYADLIKGVVFNTETALTVDVKGMMDAQKQFMAKVLGDEDIKAAIDSIASMIPGASFDAAQIVSEMQNTENEVIPEVAGLIYTITDDEGNQSAPNTYVIVSADVKEHPEGNTNTYVYVAENSLDIQVEVPAQEVSVEIYGELVEQGVTVNIGISAAGVDVEIAGAVVIGENSLNVDAALYMGENEKPLVLVSNEFAMGGERTKKASDGEKAELALDGLLDEQNAANIIGALAADAMTNGLTTVLNNIKTVMPVQGAVLEQMIGQIMSQFMGGGATEEAPVEEAPVEEAPATEEAPAA